MQVNFDRPQPFLNKKRKKCKKNHKKYKSTKIKNKTWAPAISTEKQNKVKSQKTKKYKKPENVKNTKYVKP